MKRTMLLATLILGLVVGFSPAQSPGGYKAPKYGPGYRPQLSPYLNLLRGGNPAANYYLGTLPEQQRRQQAAQFGADIAALEKTVQREDQALGLEDGADTPRITSGHPTGANTTLGYFNNTQGYFGGQTGGVAAGAPGGGAGAGARPAGKTGRASGRR